MIIRIRLIFPGVNTNLYSSASLNYFKSREFEVEIAYSQAGPATIASRYEGAIAIPGVLQQISLAEKEGADAVVVDCMGDPGVEEGRELVHIPVIGPSQTAMHVASTLGERFAVITMTDSVNPLVRQHARLRHLEARLAAVLSIGIPPALLQQDATKTIAAIYENAIQAISEYGADTIIFGCTGMMGCAENVREYLLKKGYDIPVIDPTPLAIHYAKMLVELKLSHSKQLYGQQTLKSFFGYEFLAPASN